MESQIFLMHFVCSPITLYPLAMKFYSYYVCSDSSRVVLLLNRKFDNPLLPEINVVATIAM